MKLEAGKYLYERPEDEIRTAVLDLKLGDPPFFPLAEQPWSRVEEIHEMNPQHGVPMYWAVEGEWLRVWPIPREDFILEINGQREE